MGPKESPLDNSSSSVCVDFSVTSIVYTYGGYMGLGKKMFWIFLCFGLCSVAVSVLMLVGQCVWLWISN